MEADRMEERVARGLTWAKHRYSAYNRARKAEFAVRFGRDRRVGSVLLVGVGGDRDGHTSPTPTTNLVERAIEDAFDYVVATGLDETSAGWRRYVQADALDLPFAEGEFDLVYSNAVVEHVGQADAQVRFVDEHRRVGRHWVFTTPNRLFPVDPHTMTVVRHMSQSWRPPTPAYTRLLSPADVRAIVPAGSVVHGRAFSPTLTAASD